MKKKTLMISSSIHTKTKNYRSSKNSDGGRKGKERKLIRKKKQK